MDFQVLGPVTGYEATEQIDLGGPKQRLVLAMLLVARGASVSTSALIDGLWMDSPPATARKTLQGYVHHLRHQIGDALVTDKAGYSLQLHSRQVDERRFGEAVDEAEPLVDDDPLPASEKLTDALKLWHGNPYADLDGEPVLRPEITRLGELRVLAVGARIDADLALGRHEALIGELESLIVEYPLHERFRAQHMLALYRSGRHGEALRSYARTRDLFIEEMGIEPSAPLAALEDQILARDPSLDCARPPASGSTTAVRGYELRETIASDRSGTLYRGYQRSVGREVAVRVIGAGLADDPSFVARYEADAMRVAKLNHPNIVYVQDTWREPGRVYQVMQWIEGERLDTYLASHRRRHPEAPRLLQQIGDALAVAHRAGVVHGDLSARSVLIAATDDAYLTDFAVGVDPADESDDRIALATIAHQLLLGAAPVVDDAGYRPPPATDVELTGVFERALVGDGYAGIDPFLEAVQRSLGQPIAAPAVPARSSARNPYKGLQAFQAVDAADFFGRDALVDRVHDVLTTRRFVAVVGPSGSGKSSLVRAGLAARLGAAAAPVLVTDMYPGAYPFEELEAALRRVSVSTGSISDQLVFDQRGLARVLRSVLPGDHTELVLAIDQFEELFSRVSSEAVRAQFLQSLVVAATEPDSRLRVVITMRADFFDRPLLYPEFGALLEAGLVPVSTPDEAGLAAAIEGPARSVGVDIEPGLTQRIIHDVADQPGGLPLMQYALTELFDRRHTDVLTLEAYRESGGVVGALAARADELFAGLDPAGQQAMHQAFLRLVTVDESAGHVRRRVARAELAALGVDRAALNEGLQRFGAHRLLTFDADPASRAPTVEVAHEALLAQWDRLHEWIEEQRDHIVLRKRLDAAMREWNDAEQDSTYLLGGGRLAQFDSWAGTTPLAMTEGERTFLRTSRDHQARTARRAASRRHRVMAVLAAAAVIAACFGVYALAKRDQAAQEAFDAETARLGNQAAFVSERNRQLALLMAVETFRRDPGFEGLSALQRVLVDADAFLGVVAAGHDYQGVRWVTDDRMVAATDREVHLLTPSSGDVETLPIDLIGGDQGVSPAGEFPTTGVVAASPAGFAAVLDSANRLWLVDVTDGRVDPFPGGDGSESVAISDDGSLIAVGSIDGRLTIFDRRSGATLGSVVANPNQGPDDIQLDDNVFLDTTAEYRFEGIGGLAFDPAGRRVVSVGGFVIRAWNVDDLSEAGPEIVNAWGADEFNLYANQPQHFWFDRSDDDVLVVAGDRFVVQWRLSTGERVSLGEAGIGAADSADAAGVISGAVGGADGQMLTLTGDGRVIRLDLARLGRRDGFEFETQQTAAHDLAIAPSGSRFAVATDDGVVVGALDGSRLFARAVPIGQSSKPTLSRNGRTLAAGLANDGLFDLTSSPPARVPFDVNVEVAQFAGSPASFSFTPTAQADVLLWTSTFMEMRNAYDLDSGDYLGDVWGPFVPAWSDRGDLLARAGRAGGTRIEHTVTGATLYENPRSMTAADFDQDGARVVITLTDEAGSPSALLVDLATGDATGLPDMPAGVFRAAFTPDGTRIVAIGGSGAVWVLDARSLERVATLQDADIAADRSAQPPSFTASGDLMFSASDGVARLWSLESGRQLGKPFPSEAGGVPYGVADGDVLRLVTPVAGQALIWDLDTSRWMDIACVAAGRNMTPTEWTLFGPRDADHRATCPEHEEGAP